MDELTQTIYPADADHARVIVVALTICHHREGRGHRFSYNPGVVPASVEVTQSGRRCLASRNVV